ncbi:helix-turn-helix domain-containing protein [Streptomyces kasugaensis]
MRVQNFSQRKLAACAHVSQAFISLLLHGKRGARPETAWRIASALGVFTDELFEPSSAPAVTPTKGHQPVNTAPPRHTPASRAGHRRTRGRIRPQPTTRPAKHSTTQHPPTTRLGHAA